MTGGDFRSWTLHHGIASDFNRIVLNRRQVALAQRIKHGNNGVSVTLVGASPLTLTATFDEFEAWLTDTQEPTP